MANLFQSPTLVNTQEIPLHLAQKIAVSYIFEDITIYETDGESVLLKEYFNSADPSLFARVSTGAEGITIEHGERPLFSGGLRGYVELFLPKAYFSALRVKTVSGKIDTRCRLALSEVSIASTSGRIALKGTAAGNASISTVSGSITVDSLQAVCRVHSTSGSIHVGSATGSGEFKTVSGTINAEFDDVLGDIHAHSISGRVSIFVPQELCYTLQAHSVSGSIHTPYPTNTKGERHTLTHTVGESPSCTIRLNTVSGNIHIAHRK